MRVEYRTTRAERDSVRADLMRHRDLVAKARSARVRADSLRSRLGSGAIDGMPRGGGLPHGLDCVVARAAELEERAAELEREALEAWAEARAELGGLEDSRMRDVAEAVVLDGMTVEEAADACGWSPRYGWILWGLALDALALARR